MMIDLDDEERELRPTPLLSLLLFFFFFFFFFLLPSSSFTYFNILNDEDKTIIFRSIDNVATFRG